MTLPIRFLGLEHRLYTRLRLRADDLLAHRATASGNKPKPPHLLTGERGEDAAFFHLRSLGYTVVARRWHSSRRRGDLDLVAWDGPTLIFFEVKTRTARDLFPADAEVNPAKQQTLRRMAAAYLHQFPESVRSRIPIRFDVLSVYLLPNGSEFEHFPSAFALRDQRHTR